MKKLILSMAVLLTVATIAGALIAGKKKRRYAAPQRQNAPDRRYIVKSDGPGKVHLEPAPPDPVFDPYFVWHHVKDNPDLANQAVKIFHDRKPGNQGRHRTFFFLDDNNNPFIQTGWSLDIINIEETSDGWNATVRVHAQASPKRGGLGSIDNYHLESWHWNGHHLTLKSEQADTRGMFGALF
jgi:hypothetical protein